MKRILSFLLLCYCFLSVSFAQLGTNRNLTIVEASTGTWCVFCPGSALAAKDMIQEADKVAILKYHAGDPYETSESDARIDFYNITGFPTTFMNGTEEINGGSAGSSIYNNYLPVYNMTQAETTPIEFSMEVTPFSAQNYTAKIKFTKVSSEATNNLALHLVVTESNIPDSWFIIDDVSFAVRDMIPDENGTAISLSNVGDVDSLTLPITLGSNWVPENVEIVAFIQDMSSKKIYNGSKAPTYAPTGAYDLDVEKIVNEDEISACNDAFAPDFLMLNNGSEELTSFDVKYSINGGPVGTYNWTGNIKFYDRARIALPPISYTNQKNNELKVMIENINGVADSANNQEIVRNWSGNISAFGAHTLLIQPDQFASQNNWIIKSQQFGILAGGGPYTDGNTSVIVESINLPVLGPLEKNCYSFEIYDTGGDGFTGGSYYLINAFGDTIASNATGEFGANETTDFNLTWSTDIEQELTPQFAQVFPNPSSGLFQVQLAERPQQAFDWQVFNLNGSLVAQGSTQQQELSLDLSDQANGIYQIVLRSSDKMWSQKLIKH